MAEKAAFVRKHFFINRGLQVRYMLAFLIPMLVMLVFMLFTLYFASSTVVTTTTSTIKKDIQDKKTIAFQDSDPTVGMYERLYVDIDSYLRNFASDSSYRKVVLFSLLWVFGIGVFLIIFQIVLMTIFFSHKFAGPIYRFELTCHDIIRGDFTRLIHLRKGDEMQNLAQLLNDVITVNKERFVKIRDAQSEDDRKKLINELKL